MRTLVEDLMATDVAAVCTDTPARAIAEVLDLRGVSAVPVVDLDNRVVGIVSEADIIHHRYTDGSAETIMSRPAITVHADQPAEAAAQLIDHYGIKRLPVVDDLGRLVGIISRADLVHLYARGGVFRAADA
ncbi:MAG TPA: CBS domain-containing protein [Jiangellales bacterium]|nr:CBS domain-containing protein [Jiangellales bacterium]